MSKYSPTWMVLASLAVVQAIVGLVLLSWALPLFVDPPLLGNGVAARARELQELALAPGASPRLSGIGEHYRWLFWRSTEGVEAGLAASVALLGSSVLTWIILVVQPRAARAEASRPSV